MVPVIPVLGCSAWKLHIFLLPEACNEQTCLFQQLCQYYGLVPKLLQTVSHAALMFAFYEKANVSSSWIEISIEAFLSFLGQEWFHPPKSKAKSRIIKRTKKSEGGSLSCDPKAVQIHWVIRKLSRHWNAARKESIHKFFQKDPWYSRVHCI